MATFIAFSALIIGLAEGIPLGKQGQWREFAVMTCLLLIAICLMVADWFNFPSPLTLLDKLLGPLGEAIFK